jgi:hypothetical protein
VELIERISDFFLHSSDFNGISLTQLSAQAGLDDLNLRSARLISCRMATSLWYSTAIL